MLRLKYQPKKMQDLVGQKIIKQIFKRIFEIEKDTNNSLTMYPTLLLHGIRGLGKTLSSKIFAKTINCLNKIDIYTPCGKCTHCVSISNNNNTDFVELDAATYNGVENIRSTIIEHSKYPPINLKYRIYLIDEVHMLTKESFNSLLKTIEYPPENIIFLLATTELEKIPDTVRSRCLILDFQPVNINELMDYSKKVLQEEKYTMEDEAIYLLCTISGGSVRDLMVLIEKAILCQVNNKEQCLEIFGCCTHDEVMDIYFAVILGNKEYALKKWKNLQENGCSQRFFLEALLQVINNAIIFKNDTSINDKEPNTSINIPYKIPNEMKEIDNNFLAKHWEIAVYMLSLDKTFYYNHNWVKLTLIFLCHMTYSAGDEETMDYLCKMLPLGDLKSKIWNI